MSLDVTRIINACQTFSTVHHDDPSPNQLDVFEASAAGYVRYNIMSGSKAYQTTEDAIADARDYYNQHFGTAGDLTAPFQTATATWRDRAERGEYVPANGPFNQDQMPSAWQVLAYVMDLHDQRRAFDASGEKIGQQLGSIENDLYDAGECAAIVGRINHVVEDRRININGAVGTLYENPKEVQDKKPGKLAGSITKKWFDWPKWK